MVMSPICTSYPMPTLPLLKGTIHSPLDSPTLPLQSLQLAPATTTAFG